MHWLKSAFVIAYFLILAALALYGLHRCFLLYLYYRHKGRRPSPPAFLPSLPKVTVHLPLYNEQYVVERLIGAVAGLDYPRDLLEIQVLDDSTDETQAAARACVNRLRQTGLDIKYLHRADRSGFKAGALAEGLKSARGDLLAVFDADFVPRADFLRQTVPYFADALVGMVQVRWEHFNRDYSLLTKAQAIFLDGHFQMESTARHRSGRFFNFNGAAGVWRKDAIISAGGWQPDTLSEDLDLSYRAQLAGWKFVYLPDVAAPAELPVEINAFKSQQHRWVKGGFQTARKLLPRVWRSRLPLRIKLEAAFHMTNGLAYVFIMLLSLMFFPAFWIRGLAGVGGDVWPVLFMDLPLFLLASASASAFYIASQRELRAGGTRVLKFLPFLVLVGVGISLSNAKAVFGGLFGRMGAFERTPKHGVAERAADWKKSKYRGGPPGLLFFESLFVVYLVVAICLAVVYRIYVAVPFLLLFLSGYLYVAATSAAQSLWRRPAARIANPSEMLHASKGGPPCP